MAGPVSVTVTVSTGFVKVQLALLIPSNPVGTVPLYSNSMGSWAALVIRPWTHFEGHGPGCEGLGLTIDDHGVPLSGYEFDPQRNLRAHRREVAGAKKLQSSLAVEGELPEDGLAAYGDGGDDLMMALARKIVSGEEDDAETMEEVFAQARDAEATAEEYLVDDDWKVVEVEPETVAVNGNGHHTDDIERRSSPSWATATRPATGTATATTTRHRSRSSRSSPGLSSWPRSR